MNHRTTSRASFSEEGVDRKAQDEQGDSDGDFFSHKWPQGSIKLRGTYCRHDAKRDEDEATSDQRPSEENAENFHQNKR